MLNAELIPHSQTDLSVVNIARVSFNKQADTFNDKRDRKLISYLAKHRHISPFFHQRFAFKGVYIDLHNLMQDEALHMGFIYDRENDIYQHSFYGWVNLLTHPEHSINIFPFKDDADAVTAMLIEKMPVSSAAYGLEYPTITGSQQHQPELVDEESLPDAMKTVSMRLTAPIFVMRQMFTHRRFATNEVSRRYVDTLPELYSPTSWRKRPDASIKQGSGGTTTRDTQVAADKLKSVTYSTAFNAYKQLLDMGIAPEQARMVLPQSMVTQAIFTGSVDAWLKMLNLRLDSHAQAETRELAQLIEQQLANATGA